MLKAEDLKVGDIVRRKTVAGEQDYLLGVVTQVLGNNRATCKLYIAGAWDKEWAMFCDLWEVVGHVEDAV